MFTAIALLGGQDQESRYKTRSLLTVDADPAKNYLEKQRFMALGMFLSRTQETSKHVGGSGCGWSHVGCRSNLVLVRLAISILYTTHTNTACPELSSVEAGSEVVASRAMFNHTDSY